MERVCVIDIGGTKSELVFFTNETLITSKIETPNTGIYDEDLLVYRRWLSDVLPQSPFKVVVSFPGLMRHGEVVKWPNQPTWDGHPLLKDLQEIAGTKQLEIHEDGNMAAACSLFLFPDTEHALSINAGTGIGAGLLLSGRVFSGECGFAGELGHTVIEPNSILPCSCGKRGCLQLFSSGRGMLERLKERYFRFQSYRRLDELIAENDSDDDVQSVLAEGAKKLALAVSNLITLMDITRVQISGSVFTNPVFEETFILEVRQREQSYLQREIQFRRPTFHNPSLAGALIYAVEYPTLSSVDQKRIQQYLQQDLEES